MNLKLRAAAMVAIATIVVPAHAARILYVFDRPGTPGPAGSFVLVAPDYLTAPFTSQTYATEFCTARDVACTEARVGSSGTAQGGMVLFAGPRTETGGTFSNFGPLVTAPGTYYGSGGARLTVIGPAAVAAVPEPAAWATMALGLGLAGAALRRRRAPRTIALH